MENLLSSLNSSQKAAVEHIDGAELVIAGAGSGKTRVLTYKIAYMINQGIKPWNILALTFTNKAAKEMKERIATIVGTDKAHYLNMGTFHSIFLRILRCDIDAIGLKSNFTIYDDADSRSLVKSIVKEMHLDDKIYKSSNVLSRISMAKNSLITPDVYIADISLTERDRENNMPKIGEVYRLYTQRCRMANAIDFDDMLMYTYILLKNHPEICHKYSDRFKYILVDEYQDTNYAQQSILTLLTQEHSNICVVGDDAQSIYAFRGANIDNILNFQNIYHDAKLFKLEQNYRSTQNIVNAANCLIEHNRKQIPKKVFSENSVGDKVTLNITYSDKEEASIVGNEVQRMHIRDGLDYRNFAILYRTNAQSRLFEDELRRQNIPYIIYGGMSFYQRKEIKDIVAYFRVVANPEDEEALKRIINYPKRGIGDASINKMIDAARQNGVGVWTIIGSPMTYVNISTTVAKKIVAFHDMIQTFIDQRTKADAFVLGKKIIEGTGLSKEIFSDYSDETKDRKDNVDEFVSGLHDYVDTKREEGNIDEVYISDFLQEVALTTDTDTDKGNDLSDVTLTDRVTLMTIHASKGLEFNTVFVVGMEENIFPSPRACNSSRGIEEERRLFYVAITRAEKHCILSCSKSRYQYGNMMFNEPSRFLHEIDSAYMKVNGNLKNNRCYGKNTYNNTESVHFNIQRNSLHPISITEKRMTTCQKKDSTNTSTTLKVGAKIEHQRFGCGTVMEVEGKGENEKATVEFTNVGIKTLLLKFARYKIL